MRVFRIYRKATGRDPLDGRGGLVVGGRWHDPPRLVVYASESLSLASLEVLVHADFDLVPKDLVAVEIDVPDGMKIHAIAPASLPRTWRDHPAPASLRRRGNVWLDRARSSVLRVPSAIIPSESNYLLNPRHPDIRKVRVLHKTSFRFDPRLVAK